jgi:hypothetical protein
VRQARCQLVGDECQFAVVPNDPTHRCLVGLGFCVFDADCSSGETCEQQEQRRPYGLIGQCVPK